MSSIVKYYAPRDFKNLSSALSYKVFGELRGAQMKWVPLSACHDYIIAGGYNLSNAGHKAHVWCGGYTKPYGPTNRPQKIYSVRGPLSKARAKQHMNVSAPCAGDPLLLFPDIHDVPSAELKPCLFTKSIDSIEIAQKDPNIRHVTVSDSLDTILISIKNATYVMTDMLEGLVLSDAFAVRSTCVSNGPLSFVIRDYLENFTSSSKDSICVDEIATCNEKNLRCRNITTLKNSLIATLPDV